MMDEAIGGLSGMGEGVEVIFPVRVAQMVIVWPQVRPSTTQCRDQHRYNWRAILLREGQMDRGKGNR